jgi:hypothetical protein
MRYWAAGESVLVAGWDGSASGVHGDGVLSMRTHRMSFLTCGCIVTSPFTGKRSPTSSSAHESETES